MSEKLNNSDFYETRINSTFGDAIPTKLDNSRGISEKDDQEEDESYMNKHNFNF